MIVFDHVAFSFGQGNWALSVPELHINSGEFIAIVGENGSGKSTLARLAAGLYTPTAGMVKICGFDTASPQESFQARSSIGFVFQNPDDQLVAAVVQDEVAFGPQNLGLSPDEVQHRVTNALKRVDLEGFEQHEVAFLSGGQKQALALAGALAMRPQLLFLDEATSMLDPQKRQSLMRLCQSLHEEGVAIVLVTHYMDEAARANRVIVLQEGQIVAQGSPQDVLTNQPLLKQCRLEAPFTVQLCDSLRERHVGIDTCCTEEELIAALIARYHDVENGRDDTRNDTLLASGKRADEPLWEQSTQAGQGDLAGQGTQTGQTEPAGQSEQTDRAGQGTRTEPATQTGQTPQTEQVARTAQREANDIISVEKLCFSYGETKKHANANWALRDLTFSVQQGECLGIAGHTGSGKSTLLSHMNGLLRPQQGCVCIAGRKLETKRDYAWVLRQVGLVFQYPEHQLFASSVLEDVCFGPRNLGLSPDEARKNSIRALKLVGLDPGQVAKRNPFKLSGGEQRRVALAGVLAMQPRVLVLDEPGAGLDPQSRREFRELIRRLHHQEKLTLVISSHDMDELGALCDRVLMLDHGSIAELDNTEAVFQQVELLQNLGLEAPRAERFAQKIAEAGLPIAPPASRGLHSLESLGDALEKTLSCRQNRRDLSPQA